MAPAATNPPAAGKKGFGENAATKKSKSDPKGKGKGKGRPDIQALSASADQQANNLKGISDIFRDCKLDHASHKLAVPLLTELRDLMFMGAAGPSSPMQNLIPKLQDIILEVKQGAGDAPESSSAQANELIHATKYACWEAIKAQGLKGDGSVDFVAVNRQSKRGCIAGVIGADLLIYVNRQAASRAGIAFSQHPCKPDTILCHTDSLDARYFSKVVDVRSGELLWDLSHGGSVKDAEFTTDRLRQMKLYSDSRIQYSLHKAVDIAYANGQSLKCSDLGFMDQLHYLGYDCIDTFFGRYAPGLRGTAAPIIDIGAGLGGSSRYMWEQYGARVTSVEYQRELCKVFAICNRLLHIPPGEVSIEQGDFAHMDLPYLGMQGQFSAFVSQLVFLHIADKASLFEKCSLSLCEGGYFMIEDYFVQDGTELSEFDKLSLAEDVSVPNGTPSSESKYRELLTTNGLVIDEWLDMTDRWVIFIWERCEAFLAARVQLEADHGPAYVREQAHFFGAVTRLYHKMPADERTRFPLVCALIAWQPDQEAKPQHLRGVRIFGRKVTSASTQ